MGYTADKAYLTRDQPQTEFSPLNKAKCSIFDEFSKFLYLNKVTLKSGRYQKLGKKMQYQCFKSKTGTCNAKSKKIKYINVLCYDINSSLFTKLVLYSAHKMDGASYFIFPF